MEPYLNLIQRLSKWWSRKQGEAELRMEMGAQLRQQRELKKHPNWEDHQG